jgi:hypothetical protein
MSTSNTPILAPATWPGAELAVQPSDLTHFAPLGMNLGGMPLVIRPWESLDATLSAGKFYATQPHGPHPIRDAPVTSAAGGVVYFGNSIGDEDLAALMRVLRVPTRATSFAAFRSDAERPIVERYLTQLRIVNRPALEALFGAEPHAEFVSQPIDIGATIAGFVANELERWGMWSGGKLTGSFGGDGDWASEDLCFGFMVENEYHGVFRIWSRAWLVTK